MSTICQTCMHHCSLDEGQTGLCRGRKNNGGTIEAVNYGRITSLELDRIEKKPLRMFHPNSYILSAGSFGCNLKCPFCQNSSISQAGIDDLISRYMSPAELVTRAIGEKRNGNIGLAFTYNEPLIGWEYVRDTAKLAHDFHLQNVVVTNGSVMPEILDEVLPYIDAMNIDLKGFSERWYKELGGDFETVKACIKKCAEKCHVEIATLIIPGKNDSENEMRKECEWIASIDKNIALHITRFFPHYKMSKSSPTDVSIVYGLAGVAQGYLPNVFTGNC